MSWDKVGFYFLFTHLIGKTSTAAVCQEHITTSKPSEQEGDQAWALHTAGGKAALASTLLHL